MIKIANLFVGLLVSLQCVALDLKVPDETLSKRIVFEFISGENGDSGRLVVFIPNLNGFEPEKCELEDENFEGTFTLSVYETHKGFVCGIAYESEGSERHTVKIHYKGTNKIAVGTYTHNKAHQARPHAGWTSVPVLALRLSLTLPQNNHLHCGPCGRR